MGCDCTGLTREAAALHAAGLFEYEAGFAPARPRSPMEDLRRWLL